MNVMVELRFDCLKFLVVKRRRFPAPARLSLAWVVTSLHMMSQVAIFVNVLLLLAPYRQIRVWSPHVCRVDLDEDINSEGIFCTWDKIFAVFFVVWTFLEMVYIICYVVVRRLAVSFCVGE